MRNRRSKNQTLKFTSAYFLAASALTTVSPLMTTAHSATVSEGPFKIEATQGYALYRNGDYSHAISAFETLKASTPNQKALLEYWIARCQSKLQLFEQASANLLEAQKQGFQSPDLQFELGQALYTTQQLAPAREAFRKSSLAGYKAGASLYYEGYISQLLEEVPVAWKTYLKILRMPADPDKVKQAAMLQMAELSLAQAEKITSDTARNFRIRNRVMPDFQRVAEFEAKTPAAELALARLQEIEHRLGGDIPRMVNGVPIASKAWYVRATQDTRYDTNVITQAEESITDISNRSSSVSTTSIFAKYEQIYDRRWSISPEASAAYTYYLNRDEPQVFQNDNTTVNGALRTRLEHSWFGEPAAFLVDAQFEGIRQDYSQTHELQFYSNSLNFSLGERARVFGSRGSTTLLANFKVYRHQDDNQSALIPGFTLSQNTQFDPDNTLSLIFNLDSYRANSADYVKYTYRLTSFFNSSSLIQGIRGLTLSAGLDLMLVNPVNLQDTRGIEKLINPSVSIRKDFFDHLFVAASYGYTKYISLDVQNYAYSKQIFGLSLGGQF